MTFVKALRNDLYSKLKSRDRSLEKISDVDDWVLEAEENIWNTWNILTKKILQAK